MQKNKEKGAEELPIEEFDNDTQNIREEFLKNFPSEKQEEPKEDKKEIKKGGFLKWL